MTKAQTITKLDDRLLTNGAARSPHNDSNEKKTTAVNMKQATTAMAPMQQRLAKRRLTGLKPLAFPGPRREP